MNNSLQHIEPYNFLVFLDFLDNLKLKTPNQLSWLNNSVSFCNRELMVWSAAWLWVCASATPIGVGVAATVVVGGLAYMLWPKSKADELKKNDTSAKTMTTSEMVEKAKAENREG